jgi:hypothetical protein
VRNGKINISFIILGLFFLVLPLWAETDVFRYPLGPQTMEAFKKTCDNLAERPIVKGNFEQEKILSRLNRSLKSSGNFIIAAELGMVWETLRPFPSTLALGKDYLVQSRPGGQATLISAQGNETFIRLAEVISTVFSGQSQGLLNNFQVYYLGSPASWELGLLPLDRAIASFALTITMKGDAAIRSIIINEQNGDATLYMLSNHSYPQELNTHERAFFTVP